MREPFDDFAVGRVWEVGDEYTERREGYSAYQTNATVFRVEGLFKSPRNIHTCIILRGFNSSDKDGLNRRLFIFRDLDPHEWLIKRVIHQGPRNDTLLIGGYLDGRDR